MATENKAKSGGGANTKKRKQRYLPHNKPVKKKGAYPLHPGVQGFFITCDGGRERQASHEAINVIDSFYEELIHGKDSNANLSELSKPLNKKIKFVYSDDEEDDDNEVEEEGEKDEKEDEEEETKSEVNQDDDTKSENATNEVLDPEVENTSCKNQTKEESNCNEESGKDIENEANEAKEPPAKKHCIETCVSKSVIPEKAEQKSVDKLIEEELKELGDQSKRHFVNLDSGCNGVVFVQMRKRDGDPSPKDIVQHMMTSAASTRKHMSRFILRVLPVEVACYASEEEISKAMEAIVAKYFPVGEPLKFAVLYEARANTGIDRMKIINSVAKSVPAPHKVDLNNPSKTIIVEIVKTICLIGVVEKYKELAKYNLRQLTSSK